MSVHQLLISYIRVHPCLHRKPEKKFQIKRNWWLKKSSYAFLNKETKPVYGYFYLENLLVK